MAWGFVAVLALGGCSVGAGSPDGWVYLRWGAVAVAHPKTWSGVRTPGAPAGAVLRAADGRQAGALTVWAARRIVPRGARVDVYEIGGRRAQRSHFVETGNDGVRRSVYEVATTDSHGRPVLVRAVGGLTSGWQQLLHRIVNSVEVS